MGSRMFQLLLMSVFTVLFMNENIQFCFRCEFHDGSTCFRGMKSCWKFKIAGMKRACVTDNFYYYDRIADRYHFRYSVLSCRACEEGSFMIFHDLYRETFCCTEDKCNNPEKTLNIE
ncbi:hypothetical protein MJG53_016731 [Ovis ammon polii x Ovis aries]|uniref:Uncharacterized protein n=2 Tax=Ovis TaxID=9935 RepID=A0AAD4TNQ4_OVIAM|nr:hypothetical protein MG293_019768 [Ovis ammon polii]KAI4553118.1 hypothetical protein MJT46_016412 [Ovis ammon polii x Ovis aries]KAI4561677.1 hypothetical protein MJG53_016731 [Ovis ammon polii x Ovis aries]